MPAYLGFASRARRCIGTNRERDGADRRLGDGLTKWRGIYTDSFLHRLRGDVLLKRDPVDPAPGEDAFRTTIEIAQKQGARSYCLLSPLALGKHYQSTGRPADAISVLPP